MLALWRPTCKYVRLTQAASPCNASLCFCRNIYTSADLGQTNAFSALNKAHSDCKKAKGKTSKLESQQRERESPMQHPLMCPPRLPHPARRPLGPFHILERSEHSSRRQREWQRDAALAGHVPAGRGGHRQAECRGEAAMRDSAVPHEDMGLSGATGPPQLLCPQHTLTLHLLGTVISGPGNHQGTFSLEKDLCPDPPPRERASRR